eukprot:scaffold97613_cov30-Tisochrysis_lutea.AAC.2
MAEEAIEVRDTGFDDVWMRGEQVSVQCVGMHASRWVRFSEEASVSPTTASRRRVSKGERQAAIDASCGHAARGCVRLREAVVTEPMAAS